MSVQPPLNILLTNVCSNRCPYCFASVVADDQAADGRWMSDDAIERVVSYLDRTEASEVRLLGGEPLLHPSFDSIYGRLRALPNIGHITVFSGANVSPRRIACLHPDKTSVVLNLNRPEDYVAGHFERVLENLAALVDRGVAVTIGYNLYRLNDDHSWLLSACDDHGIKRVRIAIANPTIAGDTEVPGRDDRRAIGADLHLLLVELDERRIRVTFDCLVSPCMFTDAQWGDIARRFPYAIANLSKCSPALDVHTDLRVTRCFGTDGNVSIPLEEGSPEDLAAFFYDRIDRFRRSAAPPECRACEDFKRNTCDGGCLALAHRGITAAAAAEHAAAGVLSRARGTSSADAGAAIALFEHALKSNPADSLAAFDYLWTLLRVGRSLEGSPLADSARAALAEGSPDRASVIEGTMAEARGDRMAAIAAYRRAIQGSAPPLRVFLETRLARLASSGGTQ